VTMLLDGHTWVVPSWDLYWYLFGIETTESAFINQFE
jgi:hypothetical protein